MMEGGGDTSFDFGRIFNLLTTKWALWLLVLIGIVVHSDGLFGGFIGDDKTQILTNYIIHSLGNIPRFFTGSTFVPNADANLAGPFYKPFLSLSYAVLWALFSSKTFYYHAFQLSLHITNAVLVFILFKKFLKDRVAFFLALLFVVHPINSEAVVYIADLQEPLFFCFGILALLLAMKETISPQRALAISGLLLCSLLSKETGVLFVLMVIITRLFIRWRKQELVLSLVYAVTPAIVYLFLRFVVARIYLNKIPGLPITLLPLSQRLLTVPAVIAFYLKTFIYPARLDFFQIWIVRHAAFANFYLPLLVDAVTLTALIMLGWYIYRQRRSLFLPYTFFGLWLIIGIAFHSQIVPLDLTVSERWFYFPIVGLLGLLGVMYQSFSGFITKYKPAALSLAILLVLVLVLFSVRTIVRNSNWSNETTLYNHDLAIEDSSLLEGNLGTDYLAEKDYQAALIHYQKSAELEPTLTTYYDIALTYMNTGDFKDAGTYYLKALATNKTTRDHDDFKVVGNKILENLTFIYIASREFNLAERLGIKSLSIYPTDGRLWANLAVSQYMQGEKPSARQSVTNARSFQPNDPGVQYVYQQVTTDQPIRLGP